MKQLALAILCMTLITAVEAQDFNFGVTAGPNLSTARITEGDGEYIDDIKQPAYVIGFYIGGFAELGLTDKFSLRPELLYTQLGYRYAAEEGVNGFRLKSGYITLPVFAEYSITEKLKAGLGLYFSAKLTAKAKSISSSDDDLEEYPDEWFDYYTLDKEEYKTFDFGLGIGLGYLIRPRLGVNLRYSHGLANIWDHGGGGYNRSFRLGVSYALPLNKGKK